MNALALFERDILFWIQENLRSDFLTPIMRFITSLGNAGLFWIALTVLLLIFRRTRRVGIYCAASILLGFIVVNLGLKPLVGRMRPYDRFTELTILVHGESDMSFPSGHSANSFACAWALWRMAPRKYGVPALVLAALISLSRLYVGVHYPTDVLCGIAVGVAMSEAAIRITRRLESKFSHKRRRRV